MGGIGWRRSRRDIAYPDDSMDVNVLENLFNEFIAAAAAGADAPNTDNIRCPTCDGTGLVHVTSKGWFANIRRNCGDLGKKTCKVCNGYKVLRYNGRPINRDDDGRPTNPIEVLYLYGQADLGDHEFTADMMRLGRRLSSETFLPVTSYAKSFLLR